MRNLKVALAAACAVVVGWAFTASADIPASAYVQDGLIAQWDGIENAGVGTHDDEATNWVNLAEGATDATLPKGLFTVTSNSIVFNKGRALAEGVTCASNTTPITIEAHARASAAPTGANTLLYVDITSRGGLGFDTRAGYGYAYYQPSSSEWGTQKSITKWWGNFNFSSRAYDRHTAAAVIPVSSTIDGSVGKFFQDGVVQGYKTNFSSGVQGAPNGKVYIGNVSAYYEMYGVRIYSRELTPEELDWNAKVDLARFSGGDPSGYSCDAENRIIKSRVRLQAGTGIEVSMDGETWDTTAEGWYDIGSPVTAKVRVPEGKFFSWSELPAGATLYDDKKTLTFTAGVTLSISAQVVDEPVGETVTWNHSQGNAMTCYWDEAAKWNCSDGTHRAPCAYDNVVIPDRDGTPYGAYTIIATNPLPRLGSLYIGAKRTLSLRNGWESKIEADKVVINGAKPGASYVDNYPGVMNCAGGFTESEMSNRVWIVADELVLSNEWAKITSGGYGACNGEAWHDETGMANNDCGSHGGKGTTAHSHTYGSITEPTAPGSGSWRTSNYKQNGGGAVRIQVKRVVNNGSINATGTGGSYGWGGGAGSGGSIYISCETIEGTGSVNANGGGNTSSSANGAGGGGRVAVYYDTEKQKAVDCQVAFAARGGCNLATAGTRYTVGSSGTLYFPDDLFLKRPGRKLAGWVYYGPEVTLANSLVGENLSLTNSLVELTEGAVVNVTGDLSFDGSNTRVNGLRTNANGASIAVGGDLKLSGSRLYVADGTTVSVGGDLTLADGSSIHNSGELYIKAAPTNGVDGAVGATLTVGGKWTMGANTLYNPVCNQTNLSIVVARAGSFEMASTAWVSANGSGGYRGYGKGANYNAAGYGGRGGHSSGATFGTNEWKRPMWSGCGGGNKGGTYGTLGGGAVRIDVGGGMKLGGTISANGETAYAGHYGAGPGSGGSIFLSCRNKLSGTATITANGGNGEGSGYGGGGGRIAIWYGSIDDAADITAIAAGGSYRAETEPSSNWGGDGSVYWHQIPGLMIFVR